MRGFFRSEIGAAVLWVAGSLVLAAMLTPWLYQAGKSLAIVAEQEELPAMLEWLGASCDRAKIGRFFDRALLLAALLLLPVLFRRVKELRGRALGPPEVHHGCMDTKLALRHFAVGCLLAGGMLWGLCLFIEWAGAIAERPSGPSFGRYIGKVIVPAIGASLVEEWLFRGVLLGLWLRSARPWAACLGSSLLFAFLHFLKPPPTTLILDPTHALAGLQLLSGVFLNYLDPSFLFGDFLALMVVGLILAWAKIRTGALWLSIGLHTGWIIAFKSCTMFFQHVDEHPLRPWGLGENLRSGLLPLLVLVVTAALCHALIKWLSPAQPRITVTT